MGASLEQRVQAAWARRGPLACALWPLAALYGLIWRLREAAFAHGLLATQRLAVPVVVVGNLVAGGAGKTPTVLALVALLRRHGWRPGVVSRGYGRRGDEIVEVDARSAAATAGDEPVLIARRSGVPVVVGRDRADAARQLLARHPDVDLIVCDDGLQHHRLARDLQLIVFDERGAGNGWLLPAGPLREPLRAAPPANSRVLYNAAAPSTPWPGALAVRGFGGLVPLADWWRGRPPSSEALASLAGRRVIAAAGLARPGRYFDMLRGAGLDIAPMALPDHHDFAALPWPAGADVIVTEKDAVKLDPTRAGCERVRVAALDFRFPPEFEADLLAALGPTSTRE